MSEIAGYVPGPYQGVSQAPPQVRLSGTCDLMEDCLAVLPMGIQKRPPLTQLANLGINGDAPTEAYIQEIPGATRADDVTLVLLKASGVVVPHLFNSTTLAPISISIDSAAQTYLSLNSPNCGKDLKAKTVEDVTFITNRTVTVTNAATAAAGRPFEALVFVKTGGYGRTFTVTVDPGAGGTIIAAGFSTHTGGNSNDALATGTDRIAKALYDQTDPSVGFDDIGGSPLTDLTSQGFTVSLTGAVIYLSHPTQDFNISVTDDQGGTGMTAIKGSVQRSSDLPALAEDGFTVKIAQSSVNGNSDYFVKFEANAGTTGTWVEALEPNSVLGVDPTKMPVAITNTAGTWALVTQPWKVRTVGNPTLVPDPSFVGDTIQGFAWWRGRLALLSGGSVHLSGSDSPYRLYVTSLVTTLDSDPVDLLNPADRKAFFQEITTFDQRLIAWGDEAQALFSSASVVTTSSNTGGSPILDNPFSGQVPVQNSNHRAYYLALRTTSASIYELSVDRLSGMVLPEDMSKAVPAYIPTTIDRAATAKTDFFSVYGTHNTTRIIVHNYQYSQQQNVQNGFNGWNLPYPLCGMFFRQSSNLMVFMEHPSGTILACSLDIAPLRTDPGGSPLTHLDLRITEADCTITYSATTDRTTVVLPLAIPTTGLCVYRNPEALAGYRPAIHSFDGTTMVLEGDHSTKSFWVGCPYTSQFRPTRIYKLGQDQRPEHSGTLTLNRLKLDLADVGYLRVLVEVTGRDPMSIEFAGTLQDYPDAPLDTIPAIPEIVFPVEIGGAVNTDLKVTFISDTPLGFKLSGYEWEGDYTPRAQRVT